jgi:hypothetical protein
VGLPVFLCRFFKNRFPPLYVRRFLKFVFDVALVKLQLELQYYALEDPELQDLDDLRCDACWATFNRCPVLQPSWLDDLHEPQQSSIITVSKAVLHSSRCMGPA